MYIDEFGVHFSNDKKTLIGCPRDFQGEYIISVLTPASVKK